MNPSESPKLDLLAALAMLRRLAFYAMLVVAGLMIPALLLWWYEPEARPMLGANVPGVVIRNSAAAYPVLGAEAIDGDTVRGSIVLPWSTGLVCVTIRAADYDAWELTKTRRSVEVTDEEIQKGKAAKETLANLLAAGQLYVEPTRPSGIRDAYGRPLGVFWIRTHAGEWWSVREAMEQNGGCR